MSKNKFALFGALLLGAISCAGCSSSSKDKIIIRVLNSADYIYEADEEGVYCEECGEYLSEDKYTSSIDEETGEVTYTCKEHEDAEVYYDCDMMEQFVRYMDDLYKDEGLQFEYVYDTFDTPETCYNEMMTGKSNYDIVNVSDYMIQKMMTNDLLHPLFEKDNEHDADIKQSLRDNLSDYLWGEEESIYNKIYCKKTDYKDGEDPYDYDKGVLADYAVPYMWGTVGVMYNPAFKGYQQFTLEELHEKFTSWEALYDASTKGSFSIKDSVRDVYAVSIIHVYHEEIEALKEKYHVGEIDEDLIGFNREMTVIFNRCDEETLKKISADMNKLKDNAFGFEVDSGKTDMVSGEKIGANLAWSGDATWAIYEAQTENDAEIYFSVPDEGTNIFTDSWAIPKVSKNHQYALDFIDFMCQEDQAIANMDYVGYTTSTSTEGILEYIRDMYDVNESGEDFTAKDYREYDIRYFFEGSIDEVPADPEAYCLDDAILEVWTPTTELTYEEEIDGKMTTIPYAVYGRMITAQFPEQSQLHMLCMMDDYGKYNQSVIEMWQQVRTNPLPLWAIIVLVVQVLAVVGFIVYLIVDKKRFNKAKARRIISKQK